MYYFHGRIVGNRHEYDHEPFYFLHLWTIHIPHKQVLQLSLYWIRQREHNFQVLAAPLRQVLKAVNYFFSAEAFAFVCTVLLCSIRNWCFGQNSP